MVPRPKARAGKFAEKPGHYEPAIVLFESQVNPGEFVRGEIFITGYGEIGTSKLQFYPSPNVFDDAASIVEYGHTLKDDFLTFGGNQHGFDATGIQVSFDGGVTLGWKEPTMFFDLAYSALPQLSTETKQGKAPVSFELKTRNKVRPGGYQIHFIFTYYNGSEWRATTQVVSFVVRNILQRHELGIAVVALIAAVAAILPPAVSFGLWIRCLLR